MENQLLSEHISPVASAKVIVLFGGNPYRRDEVVKLLMPMESVSIYGTLSEEDGMNKLKELKKVDLVLIGGRYSDEQRVRIRSFVKSNMPSTKTTEPGYDYPYDNSEILKHVKEKLNLIYP